MSIKTKCQKSPLWRGFRFTQAFPGAPDIFTWKHDVKVFCGDDATLGAPSCGNFAIIYQMSYLTPKGDLLHINSLGSAQEISNHGVSRRGFQGYIKCPGSSNDWSHGYCYQICKKLLSTFEHTQDMRHRTDQEK